MFVWIAIIIVLIIAYAYYAQASTPAPPPYKPVPFVMPAPIGNPVPVEEPDDALVAPLSTQDMKDMSAPAIGGTVNTTGCDYRNNSLPVTFKYMGIEPTCDDYKKALIAGELNACPATEWAIRCPELTGTTKQGVYSYFAKSGARMSIPYAGAMTCGKLTQYANAMGEFGTPYVCMSKPPETILAVVQ